MSRIEVPDHSPHLDLGVYRPKLIEELLPVRRLKGSEKVSGMRRKGTVFRPTTRGAQHDCSKHQKTETPRHWRHAWRLAWAFYVRRALERRLRAASPTVGGLADFEVALERRPVERVGLVRADVEDQLVPVEEVVDLLVIPQLRRGAYLPCWLGRRGVVILRIENCDSLRPPPPGCARGAARPFGRSRRTSAPS